MSILSKGLELYDVWNCNTYSLENKYEFLSFINDLNKGTRIVKFSAFEYN